MFGRVPNGSIVTVIDLADGKHWIRIEVDNRRTGWIIEKYVVRVVEPAPVPPLADDEFEVWSSPSGCNSVVQAGRRMAEASPQRLRVASWNIRWFPDGELNPGPDASKRTDLPWLACAITWMNLDILAFQESRTTQEAKDAWESVLDGLSSLTGGEEWKMDFQGCGGGHSQHVGFLWKASRVNLTEPADVWQFNGAADGPSNPVNATCALAAIAISNRKVATERISISSSCTQTQALQTRTSSTARLR